MISYIQPFYLPRDADALGTPTAGYAVAWITSDGKLHTKTSDGTVSDFSPGGGGGSGLTLDPTLPGSLLYATAGAVAQIPWATPGKVLSTSGLFGFAWIDLPAPGFVLPAGGTEGQYLASDGNGGASWQTLPPAGLGGGGPNPPATGNVFTFGEPGDTNGLFYWLGTVGGAQAWANPYPVQLGITVGVGNLAGGSLASLSDRQPSDVYTDATTDPAYDFQIMSGRKLTLSTWTYQVRCTAAVGQPTDHTPTRLDLFGSNDGATWTLLDSQPGLNDTVCGTWHVFTPPAQTQGYSWFRVREIGLSNSGTYHYTASEFEFYGALAPA